VGKRWGISHRASVYFSVYLNCFLFFTAHGSDGNGDTLCDAVPPKWGGGPSQDWTRQGGPTGSCASVLTTHSYAKRYRTADCQYCKYLVNFLNTMHYWACCGTFCVAFGTWRENFQRASRMPSSDAFYVVRALLQKLCHSVLWKQLPSYQLTPLVNVGSGPFGCAFCYRKLFSSVRNV
jgi:hypothetical protein